MVGEVQLISLKDSGVVGNPIIIVVIEMCVSLVKVILVCVIHEYFLIPYCLFFIYSIGN